MYEKRNICGERIKEARKMHRPKLSQLELSAKMQILGINIGDSAIGKIENGVSSVTDIQLTAFAKALNVSVLWLLGEED